jgi:hypothetical protein
VEEAMTCHNTGNRVTNMKRVVIDGYFSCIYVSSSQRNVPLKSTFLQDCQPLAAGPPHKSSTKLILGPPYYDF